MAQKVQDYILTKRESHLQVYPFLLKAIIFLQPSKCIMWNILKIIECDQAMLLLIFLIHSLKEA